MFSCFCLVLGLLNLLIGLFSHLLFAHVIQRISSMIVFMTHDLAGNGESKSDKG